MRTEDGYIINKCLNGEKEAFGFLVDKYRESIYAFAYSKLRNFHDAEDITQEVFIKAFRKLHTLRRWDNFLAWLYAITSNLCKNFLRSKFNRPDREFIAEQDSGFWGYTSMNSYQNEQAHESLHEALASLPEIYRQALTLHYLGRMTCKEIAQFLGTSPTNIKQRLSRARAKLKKEMLDMMSNTYDQQKLQPGFTFRIVEMVKYIKIKPAPRSTPLLPFGLSAATGIVLTVLMFSPHLISLTPLGALLGSPMPSETKVMAVGELPVEVLDLSEITFLSGEQGNDEDGAKKIINPQNAFAPPGEKGKWAKRADMLTARYGLSSSVVDGKIYAIGGWDAVGKITSIVEAYNPMTNTWTRRADMPTARYALSTAVVNGKIYAIGGSPDGKIVLSTVEEYDPMTDTWTKKADMPTARYTLSTAVVNGKIYAIGGWRPNAVILPTVEEYDVVIDKWTKKIDMPTARMVLSSVAVNGKIYAIGGMTPWVFTSAVEEYNPMTNKWKRKTDMPTPRAGLSTIEIDGKIYAIGGLTEAGLPLSTVEKYNPTTDEWEKRANMLTARSDLATSVVKGKIYAIGGTTGFGGARLSTVEEYDPESANQSIDIEGKLPITWGHMKGEK